MDDKPSLEDALAHFGVKGMKWGQRKKDSSTGVTRKQNRQMNREARNEFNTKKLNTIVGEVGQKAERDAFLVRSQRAWIDDYPTVMTGGEFMDQIRRNGAFNIHVTEIYARKTDEGYAINTDPIGNYKKQNFRKK